MVKISTPSKTQQEPLGGDEDPTRYPCTTLGEISLPSPSGEATEGFEEPDLGPRPATASQEVLEAFGPGGSSPFEKEGPEISPWRPDEVRKTRKLKSQAAWRARKKKPGRKRIYKTHWQRRLRRKDANWKYYQKSVGDPWRRWCRSWKQNKTAVGLTEEEFLDWLVSDPRLEGGVGIKKLWVYEKVAKVNNFLAIGFDGQVLFRGTNVPESFKYY